MKYSLVFAFCLFLVFYSTKTIQAQTRVIGHDKLIETLLEETLSIMKTFNYDVRDSLRKDAKLLIVIDRSIGAMNAEFNISEKGNLVYNFRQLDLSYFTCPKILISPLLDSILNNKKDTTQLARDKGLGVVVHEMTHYLQSVDDLKLYKQMTSLEDQRRYIEQPSELQAHTVQSFYLLNKQDKKLLDSIMTSQIEFRSKSKLLISNYWKIIYPSRESPF